jgi:hypothetical protein
MKDIPKRLLIVIHYLTFITGCGIVLEGCSLDDFKDVEGGELFIIGVFFLIGPTLRYIFGGKFLIFPWSKVKVDK